MSSKVAGRPLMRRPVAPTAYAHPPPTVKDGGRTLVPFEPAFTYALFEEDKIFGFKGLDIHIKCDAATLFTLIQVKCKALSTSPKPDDVMATLREYFPAGFTTEEAVFERYCEGRVTGMPAFAPPGEKIHEFPVPALRASGTAAEGEEGPVQVTYEVYKCNWSTTPKFKSFFARLQVFALFYIEAATLFGEDEADDDRWEVMVVFEKDSSSGQPTYSAVGYLTAYAFYHYPESVRMRVAQFLILPPFQGKGIGGELYRCMYNHYLLQSNVAEICVEDPAESFTRMRDRNDLRLCIQKDLLRPFHLPDAVTGAHLAATRSKYKFSKLQMRKLLELYLLRQSKNPFDMHDYRLFVKRHLFLENKEALLEMEEGERKSKLQDLYQFKLEEFQETLEGL